MTRDYGMEILDVRVKGIPEWRIVSLTCRVLNRPISQDVGYRFENLSKES